MQLVESCFLCLQMFTSSQIIKLEHKPECMISLVAETTSGCVISADTTVSYARGEDDADLEDDRKDLIPAEEVGEQIASALLGEIKQGGVVDSTHQVYNF